MGQGQERCMKPSRKREEALHERADEETVRGSKGVECCGTWMWRFSGREARGTLKSGRR